ncbi:unnamed protein product [Laminaria digitata]
MLECFEDMLSGRLPVGPPTSTGDPLSLSSVSSVAYRVPPSDFLKVLLGGDTTRVGALHAVLQAIGRGDLQGRAASLCVSEVRMCLAACVSGAGADNFPAARRSGNDGDQRGGLTCWRPPLAQLRELAGICLSFSVDTPSDIRAAGSVATRGDERSRKDASNRRMLMLDALPAVLGACCAATAAASEEEDNDGSSECDSDVGDSDDEAFPGARGDRGGGGIAAAAAAAATGSTRKGKGKLVGGGNSGGGGRTTSTDGSRASNIRSGGRVRSSSACRPHDGSGVAGGGVGVGGRLPERGETVLSDVLDALLDRPWPPELVLPLLVMFEEIYGLIEMLGSPTTESGRGASEGDGGSPERVGAGTDKSDVGGRDRVWWRVRSRLMEIVWTGGLEGADFTGILRQVCVLCEADEYHHWERLSPRPSPSHLHQPEVSRYATEARAANNHRVMAQVTPASEYSGGGAGDGRGGGVWGARGGEERNCGTCSGSWLSCLQELYATVPPEWLSTVELVLEQTLHQMPGVAESLLDAIQSTGGTQGDAEYASHVGDIVVAGAGRPHKSMPPGTGFGDTMVPTSNDLGLLLLLLREASPLRACSLPLLPEGMDRGRRAEEGVRLLLLAAARGGLNGCGANTCGRKRGDENGSSCRASKRGGRGGALDGVRALLRGVLCFRSGQMVHGGGHSGCGGRVGAGSFGGGSSGEEGEGGGVEGGAGGGCESSGISSERASQLLELSIRWLEEGDKCSGSLRGGGAGYGNDNDGAELTVEELASETILAVFDAVEGARPKLLRILLGGLFDQSQGGAVCAWDYMRTWEALMAQEAKQKCRRLTPYSRVVSDALGRLTLLPRGRARRVVESMLPLADVCPTQASALVSLCRKCVARVENKGRLLALHAVTCILAWNARRARSGRRDGCLDQEGMQEDLVGMFRRAFESGLQIAARADTLHLLSSKLAASSPLAYVRQSAALRDVTAANGTHDSRGKRQGPHLVPPTLELPQAVDLKALSGLREIFRMRLFRFLAHKDEVLGVGSDAVGGGSDYGSLGASQRGGDGSGGGGASREKGKKKVRRRRGGRFQFVPLRLLEECGTSSKSHAIVDSGGGGGGGGLDGGYGSVRSVTGRGVVPRDAIGHLLKCCWALVPGLEGSVETGAGDGHERVAVGPGKREDAEAIARAVLGAGGNRKGGRRRGGGRREVSTDGVGVCTPEGEALVAVVEFLEGGGSMETVRVMAPLQPPACPEGEDDLPQSHVPAPPTCQPEMVGPLANLGVVVTLAEALVECLVSGISCPPAMPFLRPHPCSTTTPDGTSNGRYHPSSSQGGAGGGDGAGNEEDLALWATADVFTLLAAATRAAEGVAGSAGFLKKSKTRPPADLSEIIASLPGETLGLGVSRGPELPSGGAGAEEDEEGEAGGATGRGAGGSGCGGKGDAGGQHSLLSESSALVFVNIFLGWAAREKRQGPAGLVAEGWDGGIGVWLGLMHSVRVLATALETGQGGREGGTRERSESVWAERAAAEDGGCRSSAEAIALAVFELRAVVGTPSAALDVLDPIAAKDTPISYTSGASSPTPGTGGAAPESHTRATNGTVPTTPPSSRRPPPGTMVTGFLKRMSDRWKAALDWGLPGSGPPRRASPRLERKRHRGSRGGDSVADSLRDEAEDLFFALRSELLRTERLVLSILLVGPDATLSGRTWAMQAKLASACRWGAGGLDGVAQPPSLPLSISASATASTSPHSYGSGVAQRYTCPGVVAGDEPEAGSGPALAETNGSGSARGALSRRVRASTESKDGGGGGGAALREAPARQQCGQGLKERGKGGDRSGGSTQQGLAAAARVSLCGNSVGDEDDGLGRLCQLAAEEMREGLENGLSVKLTQAYLDLIELLGNASLERRLTRIAPADDAVSLTDVRAATVLQVANATEESPTSTAAGDPAKFGDDRGNDAGAVLLSMLAGHCIVQATLFKRLIRAAVRFDGVGANHRRSCLQTSRTAATTLAVLDARNNELLLLGAGDEGGGAASDSGGKGICLSRAISSQYPPPPLERCTLLLVHCVRWISSRHGNAYGRSKVLVEEDASESSDESDVGERDSRGGGNCDSGYRKRDRGVDLDEGEGGRFDEEQRYGGLSGGGGGRRGRCSSRPEDVRFATSRECYMAMRTSLMEFETALSMTGGLVAGGADGSNSTDGDLADTVATVASSLRELFMSMVATTTETTTTAQPTKKKGKETAGALGPGAAPAPDEDPASTTAPTKKRGESGEGGGAESTEGKILPPAAVDVFPEHMKLLLMRVLERVYLVGRAAAMAAAAALAKPSSTFIATIVASPQTLSLSPSPPSPPPPPLAPPPPPRLSKRHQQQRAAEAAGKPGDRAGGVPTKPAKGCKTASAGRRERGGCGAKAVGEERVSAAATAAASTGSRPLQSKPASRSSRSPPASNLPRKSASEGQLRGGGCLDGGAVDASTVRFIRTAGSGSAVPEGSQRRVAVLSVVLPVVALASGDCLQVMAATRRWTEGLRAKARRAGDDPCRKRASTVLFKMDRCELEIGKAAHRARQFLDHFEEDALEKAKIETPGDGISAAAGVESAKKRKRGRVGRSGGSSGSSSGGGGGGGQAKAKRVGGTVTNPRDEQLGKALRLLIAGADTLAAWRRDASAKENGPAGPKHGLSRGKGQARRAKPSGVAAAEDADEGSRESGGGERGVASWDRFGRVPSTRRRLRGARVRSRNTVIDGWLEEGGEGVDPADAFVDLEDFIDG